MRSSTITSLAGVIAACSVATAQADDLEGGVRSAAPPTLGARRWVGDLAVDTRWMTSSSAAVAATGPLVGPRFGLSRHLLGLPLAGRRLDLAVGGRLAFGNASGELFQRLHTEVDQAALLAGAGLRTTAWRRLSVAALVEAGAARTDLAITEVGTGMVAVDDGGWGVLASAAVAADLEVVRSSRLAVTMGLELGVTLAAPVAIAAMVGDGADPDLSIATGHAALGELDTRGVRLSVSWRAGF